MKTRIVLTSIATCAIAFVLTACNKSENPTPTPPPAPPTPAADTSKPVATQATEAAAGAAAQAAAVATNAAAAMNGAAAAAVTNAPAAATSEFDDTVAAAKKAIADKDYQSALAAVNKLSGMKLTDEQQKILDELKAEVQKLVPGNAAGAADAAKGLLGK